MGKNIPFKGRNFKDDREVTGSRQHHKNGSLLRMKIKQGQDIVRKYNTGSISLVAALLESRAKRSD